MFHRVKRPFLRELREAVWPSMGWRRAVLYYKHRLIRGNISTHKIVGGLALGVGVSFSPLIGTHSLEAVFLGWLFKFNKLASWIGTGIGTPVTFPIMFWMDYKLGVWLIGLMGYRESIGLPETLTLDLLLENPLTLLLPMFIGAQVLGVIAWCVAYALLYYPVNKVEKAYRDQRHR